MGVGPPGVQPWAAEWRSVMSASETAGTNSRPLPPALIAGSKRFFQLLDLHWCSPKSGGFWYKSGTCAAEWRSISSTSASEKAGTNARPLPPALIARSNRLFLARDFYWRSPESGGLWYKSRRLKTSILNTSDLSGGVAVDFLDECVGDSWDERQPRPQLRNARFDVS